MGDTAKVIKFSREAVCPYGKQAERRDRPVRVAFCEKPAMETKAAAITDIALKASLKREGLKTGALVRQRGMRPEASAFLRQGLPAEGRRRRGEKIRVGEQRFLKTVFENKTAPTKRLTP